MELKPWLRGGVRVIITKRRWRILANCDFWDALHLKARRDGHKNPLAGALAHIRQAAGVN